MTKKTSMAKPKYCIDTSSLSRSWNRNYRPSSFAGFWADLKSLIASGDVIAPIIVRDEIGQGEEELFKWVKGQEGLFINPTADEVETCIYIVNRYKNLSSNTKSREFADPWVIAIARVRGLTVITEEDEKLNRMPDVCEKEGVPCMNMAELIEELQWTYHERGSKD